MITMETIGLTISLMGKIFVALTAILVHHRVLHEHKIDKKVFRSMKKEQLLGVLGVVLIIVGYILELPATLS